MKNEVSLFFALIGLVVGSGFISGKEIVVFFSRFGAFSFVGILLSFFIFFFLFRFILNGQDAYEKFKNSRFAAVLNILLCIIFSSAMMGGINNLLNFNQKIINYLIFSLILLLCVLIFFKGNYFFDKFNLFFVPLMLFVFVLLLIINLKLPAQISLPPFSLLALPYGAMYCFLNAANGVGLLLPYSEVLSKKQKTRVAFAGALVLSFLLLLANCMLLSNPSVFSSAMPLVTFFSGRSIVIISMAVLLGCMTSLFSLVYSASCTFRGVCKNECLNFVITLLLPSVISLCGFSSLITFLYPLASIFGAVLLGYLFFIPFFKRCNKKIHSRGKKTQNKDACHNDVKF